MTRRVPTGGRYDQEPIGNDPFGSKLTSGANASWICSDWRHEQTRSAVLAPGSKLEEATRRLIRSLRDTNPALRQIGDLKNLTAGGGPATRVEMLGNAIRARGQPILERIRLVAACAEKGTTSSIGYS
jgi:hypothetical protein